ncbi:MAG TPA: winged helix-turn-helix transcriptional regulator [Nitrososphaeraceae archaeon]
MRQHDGKSPAVIVYHIVGYFKIRNSTKCLSSRRTLAKRLKALHENGLSKRQAYNEMPPRVEY